MFLIKIHNSSTKVKKSTGLRSRTHFSGWGSITLHFRYTVRIPNWNSRRWEHWPSTHLISLANQKKGSHLMEMRTAAAARKPLIIAFLVWNMTGCFALDAGVSSLPSLSFLKLFSPSRWKWRGNGVLSNFGGREWWLLVTRVLHPKRNPNEKSDTRSFS